MPLQPKGSAVISLGDAVGCSAAAGVRNTFLSQKHALTSSHSLVFMKEGA
jgi:hypothetical protein